MVSSWKNACTTVETVIHRSASAPPYCFKSALERMMMALSVAMMRKGEIPSRRIFPIIGKLGLPMLSRIFVFFLRRKRKTKTKESTCERTVARAAPATFM